MVNTPILFIPYIRVEYARKTFDAIKRGKPKKLYFFSDKANVNKPDEIKRNNEIRSWINEIDWDCELHTQFREEKKDLYVTIREAIQWVFDNEDYAIVLEEDCCPSLAFFDFCDCLLPKYADDKRIGLITGINPCPNYNPNGCDYIFSRNWYMWGWASWKNRWNSIDWDNLDFNAMNAYGVWNSFFHSDRERSYQYHEFKENEEFLKRTKCWDFMFTLNNICNNRMAIVPIFNLVKNIGAYGANFSGETMWQRLEVTQNNSYPINREPPYVSPDYRYDKHFFDVMYYKRTTFLWKVYKSIRKKFSFLKK